MGLGIHCQSNPDGARERPRILCSVLVNEAKEQYGDDSEEAAELQAMRNTQMNASFLRASLLTSVIASGVSLLAIGTGAVSVLAGAAFLARRPQVVVNADVTADAEIA